MSTPKRLGGRYALGEAIGYGGMSEVHIAKDERLGREVAIKVLRPDLARDPRFYLRFRREAQNAASLNHPMIVSVFDTGESASDQGPMPYIVMEYVDGQTLREALQSGPLDTDEVLRWIIDVASALDFSHHNGIVHRDVKPGNIMIDKSGLVKVMDFGIARAISDATITATQTATVIGTAQYLSPEQARGETVDPRSDVYSLGCVVYELLTGSPPFTGDTALAIAYQHVREDPKPPSSINKKLSSDVDAVVLKAMSKNPANRYQSAAEMREDLQKLLAGERPGAPRVMSEAERNSLLLGGEITGPSKRAPRAHGKPVSTARPWPRTVFAGLALAAVAAIVVAFLVLRHGVQEQSYIRIPDVAGQSQQQATDTLRGAGLKTITVNKKENSQVKSGVVIDTAPQGGTSVDRNLQITLNVSAGLGQVQVPDLKNLTQSDAVNQLHQFGLDADLTGTTREFSDLIPKDRVIRSNPPEKAQVDRGTKVKLVLSNGKQQIQVPNVVGMQIDDARKAITAEGLIVGTTIDEDSTAPQGRVLRIEPDVGTPMDKGSAVTVHVSRGNLFVMPDLTGVTADVAQATLSKLGYAGALTTTADQDIPGSIFGDPAQHGKIHAQNPPAGTQFNKLSTVTIETYK